MASDATVKSAQEMLTSGRPFILATVDQQNAPQARWMGGNVFDAPFTVWMPTRKNTRKVGQLAANPAAQLVCASEDMLRTATISGSCEVLDDAGTRARLWEAMPMLSRVMSGVDDPNFAVLKFTARRVEILDLTKGFMAEVAEL